MSVDQAEPNWEPRLLVLLCNWCLYSDLDQVELARVQEQSGVRIVRIPCMGRMDPMHVLMALQEGIDGVLVAGCHLGDCHYKQGNLMAERRIALLQTVLEASRTRGRTRFAHISTADRGKLPRLVDEIRESVRALGPLKPQAASGVKVEPVQEETT